MAGFRSGHCERGLLKGIHLQGTWGTHLDPDDVGTQTPPKTSRIGITPRPSGRPGTKAQSPPCGSRTSLMRQLSYECLTQGGAGLESYEKGCGGKLFQKCLPMNDCLEGAVKTALRGIIRKAVRKRMVHVAQPLTFGRGSLSYVSAFEKEGRYRCNG